MLHYRPSKRAPLNLIRAHRRRGESNLDAIQKKLANPVYKDMKTKRIAVVEKKDHLAVHGYFESRESADKHLKQTIPVYVARGYFMDKTLTANDFEVAEL